MSEGTQNTTGQWMKWSDDVPATSNLVPPTRRLADIPRAEQRTLECQLASLRRAGTHNLIIACKLNLVPKDLDALAATCGQP